MAAGASLQELQAAVAELLTRLRDLTLAVDTHEARIDLFGTHISNMNAMRRVLDELEKKASDFQNTLRALATSP